MERISGKDMPAGLFPAMLQVQAYIKSCGFDEKMMELLQIRVSQINGCAYCLDMHTKDALLLGETLQRMISLSAWREAPYYSEQERAVLELAEALTRLEHGSDMNQIHEELLKYFSKKDIANLSLAVAQINAWNRIVRSTGILAGTYKPAAQ